MVKINGCFLDCISKTGDSLLEIVAEKETPLITVLEGLQSKRMNAGPHAEWRHKIAVPAVKKVNKKVPIFCFHS
jgi:hypothetical protein